MAEDTPRIQCLRAIYDGDAEQVQRILATTTPLFDLESLIEAAATENSIKLIKILCEFGGDKHLDSALAYAASEGAIDAAHYLLNNGATVNYSGAGKTGSLGLEWAVQYGHTAMARLFLDNGATPTTEVIEKAEGEIAEMFRETTVLSEAELRRQNGTVSAAPLPGEVTYLAAVTDDIGSKKKLLAYAGWLDSRDAVRADFLKGLAVAFETMKPADMPDSNGVAYDWRQMIGHHLLQEMLEWGMTTRQPQIWMLAVPALRLIASESSDEKIPIGASKLGGCPDLPKNVPWPQGSDCASSYVDPPESDDPCGFLGQFCCKEMSETLAGRLVPDDGLISVFAYDGWNGAGEGIRILYTPKSRKLVRHNAPANLRDGNTISQPRLLSYSEVLDVPDPDGPWKKDLKLRKSHRDAYGYLRADCEMFGYFRPTTGEDPTSDKSTQHFLTLCVGEGSTFHIQVPRKELAKGNFENAELVWLDC